MSTIREQKIPTRDLFYIWSDHLNILSWLEIEINAHTKSCLSVGGVLKNLISDVIDVLHSLLVFYFHFREARFHSRHDNFAADCTVQYLTLRPERRYTLSKDLLSSL